jgi:hypothetical protein
MSSETKPANIMLLLWEARIRTKRGTKGYEWYLHEDVVTAGCRYKISYERETTWYRDTYMGI